MTERRPIDLLRAVLGMGLGMGLGRAAFRVAWEVDRVSGLKRLRTPAGQVPLPGSMPRFEEWWAELGDRHWLRTIDDLGQSPLDEALEEVAERSARGVFRLFGVPDRDSEIGPEFDTVDPPNWHLEPTTQKEWPADLHWTEAIDAPVGDLRTTWELNRFGHVWLWARDGDVRFATTLERQLAQWEESNPFRAGVNWASGQEVALRLMSWLVGAAAFGGEFSREGFRRFVQLTYWHAFQLDAELDFARLTVPNNHLIAEALALACVGDAFPDFSESEEWRCRGLELLLQSIGNQFEEDGGYCQASHSYHRFALELLLLADRWFPELRSALRPIFDTALGYFDALVGPDGTVSNFGPNDGARLFGFYPTAPRDFRPLVALLRRRCERGSDAVGWFLTPELDDVSCARKSASFERAGLHQLVSGAHAAQLRCGPLPVRGGHSDALHVDVWIDGEAVAVDGGSYRYMSDEHDWFVSARSHNGCLVDRREPRRRIGRFTWEDGVDPELVEFDGVRGLMVGTYDALADDTCWERTVRVDAAGVTVVDRLAPTTEIEFPHDYRLHWLLPFDLHDVEIDSTGEMFLVTTPRGTIGLGVRSVDGTAPRAALEAEPAHVAPIYGRRDGATSLTMRTRGCGVLYETRFSPR